MLPVVMDTSVRSQQSWVGPVGFDLGQRMYINCSVTDDIDGIMRELEAMGIRPQ